MEISTVTSPRTRWTNRSEDEKIRRKIGQKIFYFNRSFRHMRKSREKNKKALAL